MAFVSPFIPRQLAGDAKVWRREARRLLRRADQAQLRDPLHAQALRDDANLLQSLAAEAEDTARNLACSWLLRLPAEAT